ncbi:Calpain-type cysteine protease dek1, partial [Sarracenia purpurea var. burkii]
EWNGPWSDSSPEWTDRMKHKLKHVPQLIHCACMNADGLTVDNFGLYMFVVSIPIPQRCVIQCLANVEVTEKYREISCEMVLEPNPKGYTIVPTTIHPGEEAPFVHFVFTNTSIPLEVL